MTPSRALIAPGTLLHDRYRIGALIARGGMGAVHVGMDERLGREVANKVLLRELAQEDEGRRRFEREALVVAKIGHPNVAQVLDFGRSPDGSSFLVMERVPGQTLAQILGRERRLAPARVLDLITQVLLALDAAHAAGVVHRDLKPGNVMVFSPGADREGVKLLDFGIAHFTETAAYTRLTSTGAIVGTPAYMSPEQAAGGTIDARTDLYAAGVLTYCLLAGRRPYEGDVATILERVMHGVPTPLASVVPGLDPQLVICVERAMAKDPARRFSSAVDMQRALVLAPSRPLRDALPSRTSLASPQTHASLHSGSSPAPAPHPSMPVARSSHAPSASAPSETMGPKVPRVSHAPGPSAAPTAGSLIEHATAVVKRPVVRRTFGLVAALSVLAAGVVVVGAAGLAWWWSRARSDDPPRVASPGSSPMAGASPAPDAPCEMAYRCCMSSTLANGDCNAIRNPYVLPETCERLRAVYAASGDPRLCGGPPRLGLGNRVPSALCRTTHQCCLAWANDADDARTCERYLTRTDEEDCAFWHDFYERLIPNECP